MKTKLLLFLISILTFPLLHAQNIKSDEVEYRYIKLPLTPLASSIQNYQSSIFAAYEADNKRNQEEYTAEMDKAEAEYQAEMAGYPAKVKAAEDKYTSEMEEWNKKSLAEKVIDKQILNENNKPVKQIPSQPYKRSVSLPVLKTSYDYPALASTYLILDGYQNNPENAVRIDVTLYGFDYTKPRQLTEQKSVASVVNGKSTTRQVTYYHIEFTYRHTMSVRVTPPDGKELFFLTPQELNNYQTYKSSNSDKSIAINEEQLIKTHEEKILQENLHFINDLVNDKIGFKRELRKTSLSYVKSKDETYTDLLIAFNDASAGLRTLNDDSDVAKTKLQNAVKTWESAIQEADLDNKKARINKNVTIAIYFNLLEAYFVLRDYESAEKIFSALNTLPISKSERKLKEDYETSFNDLKKRIIANQI